MDENAHTVEVRAYSPGEFTILVVALPGGGLRTVYRETDYDLRSGKPVREDWLRENAIGRHSFLPVDPPERVEVSALSEYARRRREG